DFGTLPKTLFFEYQTLDELGGYFLDSYPDAVARLLDDLGATEAPHPGTESGAPLAEVPAPVPAGEDPPPPRTPTPSAEPAAAWRSRVRGRDCASESPPERWDYRSSYSAEDGADNGGIYCRWGGFLDNADHFDPLFFNVAPRDAELMDPQERLFLQCAYATVQ